MKVLEIYLDGRVVKIIDTFSTDLSILDHSFSKVESRQAKPLSRSQRKYILEKRGRGRKSKVNRIKSDPVKFKDIKNVVKNIFKLF